MSGMIAARKSHLDRWEFEAPQGLGAGAWSETKGRQENFAAGTITMAYRKREARREISFGIQNSKNQFVMAKISASTDDARAQNRLFVWGFIVVVIGIITFLLSFLFRGDALPFLGSLGFAVGSIMIAWFVMEDHRPSND